MHFIMVHRVHRDSRDTKVGHACKSNPTQPRKSSLTHTHRNHRTADPVPHEECLHQWDAVAVGGRRGDREWIQGDGGERGRRPKKRQNGRLRVSDLTTAVCRGVYFLHETGT